MGGVLSLGKKFSEEEVELERRQKAGEVWRTWFLTCGSRGE